MKISMRASASGFLAVEQPAADERHHRGREAARQHRQPGLGRREAEHALREQREDETSAVQAEAEHDEQEDRRREIAVLQHAEVDRPGCLFRGDSSHQTIVDQATRRDDRQPHDQRRR